ncbi:MAG: NUDIX domain-containing protein [Novosphingobium sp.]|uniref:NUDIX domain-containing protein n=1 Tax=Novosphingobium sp. TaxID=1874826 RepID=UPI00273351BC|nr:NUDIX domain-containing protein [Novosphingobium sp.]MDP3550312.1 NUDIX domain-containing protein [Novosphingobium sp.]
MLSFLPGPVHRMALRTAHRLRLHWWRLTKRKVRGCNVIAANAEGHVLLVRHSYHARDTWMLPGGGLGRDESPLGTAARELREETGCVLRGAVHVGTVTINRNGWTNLIELVSGQADGTPAPDGREIEEARFFAPDALPENTSGPVREMIAKGRQNGNSA